MGSRRGGRPHALGRRCARAQGRRRTFDGSRRSVPCPAPSSRPPSRSQLALQGRLAGAPRWGASLGVPMRVRQPGAGRIDGGHESRLGRTRLAGGHAVAGGAGWGEDRGADREGARESWTRGRVEGNIQARRPTWSRDLCGAARGFGGSATARGGLFRRALGDDRWQKLAGGLPADAEIHAIAVHPAMRSRIRGHPRGAVSQHGWWGHVDRRPVPDGAKEVWSFLIRSPATRRVVHAGTSPAAVYKSENGGDTLGGSSGSSRPAAWGDELDCLRVAGMTAGLSQAARAVCRAPRWISVSACARAMAAKTWEDVSQPLIQLADRPLPQRPHRERHRRSRVMMDSHAPCMSSAAPGTVFSRQAVRMGVFRSLDHGATLGRGSMEIGRFSPLHLLPRRRASIAAQSPTALFACLSPAARSRGRPRSTGATTSAGSWKRVDRGV